MREIRISQLNEYREGRRGWGREDSLRTKIPILKKQGEGTLEKELLHGQDGKFGCRKVEFRLLEGERVGNKSWSPRAG